MNILYGLNKIESNEKIIAYHGSPFKFSKFEADKIGSTLGTAGAGRGVYFTENKQEASAYSDSSQSSNRYVYTCELTLKNMISNFEITLSKRFLTEMFMYINSVSSDDGGADGYILETYGVRTFTDLLDVITEYSDSDVEIIGDLLNGGVCTYEVIMEYLYKKGYNYTMNYNDDDTKRRLDEDGIVDYGDHYIMLNPKDIKILEVEKI